MDRRRGYRSHYRVSLDPTVSEPRQQLATQGTKAPCHLVCFRCSLIVCSSSSSPHVDPVLTTDRLIPLVAARLWLLSPGVNANPTDTSIVPSIITQATLHFSVLSASITSLRPFLRTFHMDYKWDSKVTSKRNYSSTGYTTTGPSAKNVHGTSSQSGQADRHWADDFTDPSGTDAHFLNRPSTGGTARNNDGILAWAHVDEIQTRPPFPAKAMVIRKTVDWTVDYEPNTNF